MPRSDGDASRPAADPDRLRRDSTTVALWELRPTGGGPALLDFHLALWLFNDWCIAANVADDIVPNGLGLAGCDANDARQLWDLW